jgi:hypothetical protein
LTLADHSVSEASLEPETGHKQVRLILTAESTPLTREIQKKSLCAVQNQGQSVLANKMKAVTQTALMEYGLGGSGGLNGFDPPNPPDPQSIQTSDNLDCLFLRKN